MPSEVEGAEYIPAVAWGQGVFPGAPDGPAEAMAPYRPAYIFNLLQRRRMTA